MEDGHSSLELEFLLLLFFFKLLENFCLIQFVFLAEQKLKGNNSGVTVNYVRSINVFHLFLTRQPNNAGPGNISANVVA